MKKLHVWLCLMFFGGQWLPAQDGLLPQTAEQGAADYMNAVSAHAALYSGVRQRTLVQTLLNHQYFKEQDFVGGRLSYGGVVYPDVLLRWDLYRDEMIIHSPASYNIALPDENIDYVEIHGYHIFHLRPDSLPGCPPAGNYIRLYAGDDYLLLEKLTNIMYRDDNVLQNRYNYYFVLSASFYLQRDGVYHKITNRRTLLNTLGTHRRELRRFIHARNLRYKRDAETMVLEVIKEHEKLNRS